MRQKQKLIDPKLNGNIIINELIRNMELGRFEMNYSVLLPCVFTVYLNPDDYATLNGVFPLVSEDARRALQSRVSELNAPAAHFGRRKRPASAKEYKIACRDWFIEFLSDPEVPPGDVEIHSELNEVVQPGFRGTKTTLMEREPTAGRQTGPQPVPASNGSGAVYAEISYRDDSGSQVYIVTQNRVTVGRGADHQAMDLALYASDEVSREHLVIRRDPGTGLFFITDASTNGTWVNGKKLRKSIEEPLPNRAEIGVGGVLTMNFEARP
ncbi:MAG: FHA domain-containing protein [Acidobacteriaceae bacterium]|nr:FHA domain-containing protein [Acidobacteriaceae bacterium]